MSRPRRGLRRSRRLGLVLGLVLGLLVLTPSPSWACSCVSRTPQQLVRAASTVGTGTLVWTSTDGVTRTYSVAFDRVYKGSAGVREKLTTPADEAACGLGDLATDQRYLFFVRGIHGGQMQVDVCGGSGRYDAAYLHRVEAVTGPGTDPVPEPADTGTVQDSGGSGEVVLWLLGGGALLGGGLVLLRRRRGLPFGRRTT